MSFGTIGINVGTAQGVAIDTISGTAYPVMKLDMGTSGVSNPFSGTLNTIQNGTVDTIGLINANYFGTTVFTGTSTLGTIKAAVGAGTRIYVTDLIISVGSASNVVIGDGAASTPLAGTFFFAANGGLTSNFRSPIRTSQGGTLVFQQSAAIGSCTITALGYTAP